MKGSECKFLKFMEGASKRFVIPVYQRNYDWKTENCKQLFDDLVKISVTGRKSHFFGSIVSAYNPDGQNEEYLVIDGQQRLTTISLLLLAMYNLMHNGIIEPESKILPEKIYEEYLIDKWQPEETRIKLKPVKNDQKAFGKLFDDADEHIKGSNLTANYNYFYDRIQKQEVSADKLYQAICCLEIINITLNGEDNPQLIFESLNSTGLDLSEGDKIRNFILMGLPSTEQEEYYEKYWNKIEEYTLYDVTAFIRDYLSVKRQSTPSKEKIYVEFKNNVEITGASTEEMLKDMLAYAKRYSVLIGTKTGEKVLDACIYRLNRLETTVTRPFLLEVLRLKDEGKLSHAEVTQIFLTVENFLFRRTICDLPTNTLNKIFLMLHKEIVRYDKTEDNYLEKFKYALLSKKDRARFPQDSEFVEAFEQRLVYKMNAKNKIYVFERFENFGTAEDKDIYVHCDDGTYSIEHIMPQHLTPAWEKELGEDYELIHETWLHRMANLTLTAYNSKYSNRSFTEKKTMENGFDDSGIRMNTWVSKKEQWTLKELEERNQYLMERALKIWAAPVTDYKPQEKQLDSYTLDDDSAAMTGRIIARFTYKNAEQPVTSWIEAFQKVLQMLYAEDAAIIEKLAISTEEGLAQYFTMDSNFFSKSVEISKGIYVWSNTSTQSKLNVLSKVFALYNIDPTELVFYLRDESEVEEDELGTRYELRRKYWTYALQYIHEAHGDGSFSCVHPSKENWISGFFGIQGFVINCVANYEGARVEIYLGKASQELNKKAYDYLLTKKSEIEQKLGVSLIWNRNDDAKCSKVAYTLSNVTIENETDWLQMAKFHAEWSKKLHDVIVPYLKEQD